MSLISNSENDLRYDMELSASGAMANVRLTAYKLEDGEKVLYPDFHRQILTFDALNDPNPAIQLAAGKIFEALQSFINESNF